MPLIRLPSSFARLRRITSSRDQPVAAGLGERRGQRFGGLVRAGRDSARPPARRAPARSRPGPRRGPRAAPGARRRRRRRARSAAAPRPRWPRRSGAQTIVTSRPPSESSAATVSWLLTARITTSPSRTSSTVPTGTRSVSSPSGVCSVSPERSASADAPRAISVTSCPARCRPPPMTPPIAPAPRTTNLTGARPLPTTDSGGPRPPLPGPGRRTRTTSMRTPARTRQRRPWIWPAIRRGHADTH